MQSVVSYYPLLWSHCTGFLLTTAARSRFWSAAPECLHRQTVADMCHLLPPAGLLIRHRANRRTTFLWIEYQLAKKKKS